MLSRLPSSLNRIPWLTSARDTDPTVGAITSLPNLNLLEHPATTVANAVNPLTRTQPAPLGLSDFGLGVATYSYDTPHFLGQATLSAPPNVTDPDSYNRIEPGGAHLGYVGSINEFSVQLNTVATNITYPGNSSGFFWTQNVVDWNDTGIHFVDDTFNFSSTDPVIQFGTIYSGCSNNTSGVDKMLIAGDGVFQCVGDTIPVSPAAYPVTLQLYNNVSINANDRDQVAYGFRLVEAGLDQVFTGVTDTVIFNNPGAPATPPATAPEFSVDGFALSPLGLPRDAELDLVGDIGGVNAVFRSINGTLHLEYSNASTGGWQNVPSAYDYGADTGETSIGFTGTWEPNGTEDIDQGPSMLYGLWHAIPSASIAPGSFHLEGSVSPSYGFVFVSNAPPLAHEMNWLPTTDSGRFDTYLPPLGTPFASRYYVQGFADGSAETNGTPVTSNTTAYALTLQPAPGTLDAPLYAYSNTQAAALALNVTGSASVPYRFSDLNPVLDASFDRLNDYGFPSFDCALFEGVTNPIHMNNVSHSSSVNIFYGVDDLVTNESLTIVGLWHDVDATVEGTTVVNGSGGIFNGGSTDTAIRDEVVEEGVGVLDDGSAGTVVAGLALNGFSVGIETFSSRNVTYTSINCAYGATGAPEGILGGVYAEWSGVRNPYYDIPSLSGARISSINVTKDSWLAAVLEKGTDVSFSKVNVTDADEGIGLIGVTHGQVDGSTFYGDGEPLYLAATNWTNVSGVDLSYDLQGVALVGASNSVITRNVFFNTSRDAISVTPGLFGPATGNLVYDNSFIRNNGSTFVYNATNIQVSTVAGNSFNLSTFGNCWADWHSSTAGVLNRYNLSNGVADDHPIACPGPGAYLVTFHETGLSAQGKQWLLGLEGTILGTTVWRGGWGPIPSTVSSGGTSNTPTATSVTFLVPNGTYTYLLVGPARERASDPVGSVVVAGENVTRTTTFSTGRTITLTFVEKGLAKGQDWCIGLAGSYVGCSSRASVSFMNLTPATYPFLVGQVEYWGATTLVKVGRAWVPEMEGNITATRSTHVSIHYAYAVEFGETGLAPGTTWDVKVGTLTIRATAAPDSNVTFYLINGTYTFKVLPVPGYHVQPKGGRILVNQGVIFIWLRYEKD